MLTLLCCVVAVVYLVPTWAALALHSKKKGQIVVLNLLTGWTVAGWVCALTLAVLWRHQDERSPVLRSRINH